MRSHAGVRELGFRASGFDSLFCSDSSVAEPSLNLKVRAHSRRMLAVMNVPKHTAGTMLSSTFDVRNVMFPGTTRERQRERNSHASKTHSGNNALIGILWKDCHVFRHDAK